MEKQRRAFLKLMGLVVHSHYCRPDLPMRQPHPPQTTVRFIFPPVPVTRAIIMSAPLMPLEKSCLNSLYRVAGMTLACVPTMSMWQPSNGVRALWPDP